MSAMSEQDRQKQAVAAAALAEVQPLLAPDVVLGIGTGSTVDFFIDALAASGARFGGGVPSSERTALRMARLGIPVVELNEVSELPAYVDGADEVTPSFEMIKGGGGALTREKIVAAVAARFICIVDASKVVDRLGHFPLPIEVIPMAQAQVERALMALFGPEARIVPRRSGVGEPYRTDNGNLILDVHGLSIADPVRLEPAINAIVGVVENGLFAHRGADQVLVGGKDGVVALKRRTRS